MCTDISIRLQPEHEYIVIMLINVLWVNIFLNIIFFSFVSEFMSDR